MKDSQAIQALGNYFQRGIQMKLVRLRVLAVAGLAVTLSLLPSAPSFANCGAPASIASAQLTGSSNMANCGNNAIGQFWAHKNGIWNKTSGATTNVSGLDSGAGANAAVPDGVTAGSYLFAADWNNPGVDGCGFLVDEGGGSCGDSPDPPAVDVVIAGQKATNPTIAVALFGSVDLNALAQSWILDNMGAAAVGSPCGDDLVQAGPVFNCADVPPPVLGAWSPGAAGHILNQVSFPAQSLVYPDDCAIAESKAVDCPRNLNAGRALMVRRGPCSGGAPVNNVAVSYTEAGTVSTRTELWHPYNAGDANYDGLVDATLAANPIATIGSALTSQQVDITLLTSAQVTVGVNDCLFIATAAAGDASPNAGFTSWLTPYVSMDQHSAIRLCQFFCSNGTCLDSAGASCPGGGTSVANTGTNATPVSDRIVNLVASKTGANKFSVSWSTTSENTIASFNLVGNKTSGTIDIGSSISPKGGGLGASYSISLSSSDLKGAKRVSVIVTYSDGSKASFGPIAIE
jgi:hypothetical protein